MKYYKTEYSFGKQPNNIVPDFATEITAEEYRQLETEFNAKQEMISMYIEKVIAEEMTMGEVPEEYYDEVFEVVNAPKPTPRYTLDEASEIIAKEVSGYVG